MLYKNLHTVEEGRVYRTGRLPLVSFEEMLSRLGIRALLRVVCLQRRNREYFKKAEAISRSKGVQNFNISLKHNHFPDKQRLSMILDVFDKTEYPLLIMCWRGADRSGLVSALYKMYRNYPRDEVTKELSFFPYGHLWFLHPRYHTFLKYLYDQSGGDLRKYLNSEMEFSPEGFLIYDL